MRFVIDAYNLLFAIGRLTPRSGKDALVGARQWLMSRTRHAHQDADKVIVVFDGKSGSGAKPTGAIFSGPQEADDIIEDTIRRETVPGRLTVVSDDLRLREAARRKGCVVLRCLDYAEQYLLADPSTPTAPEESCSTAPPPGDERQTYLDLFKHLDDDPELGDPY